HLDRIFVVRVNLDLSSREDPSSMPPRLALIPPRVRVWALNSAVATITVALLVASGHSGSRLAGPIHLPWWLLAIAFAGAEIFVVHVRFRRNAHTLSLNEIPLVLAFFFSSPLELVAGIVVGSAAALLIHRRQSLIKLVFNVTQLALGAMLATLCFRAVLDPATEATPRGWLAAALAVAVSSLFGVAMTALVIALAEGEFHPARQIEILLVGVGTGLSTGSLSLIAVQLMFFDPPALLLLMVPVSALFVAARAYLNDRQRSEEVGQLYETTLAFQEADGIDGVLRHLLRQSGRMFRSERVEVALLAPEPVGGALLSSAGPNGEMQLLEAVDAGKLESLLAELEESGGIIANSTQKASGVAQALGGRTRNALAVPLRGETGRIGFIVVRDRPPEVGGFTPAHLRLLQTVAGHASVALARGHLQQELRYRAFHDPLTNLANRVLFIDRLEHALSRSLRGGHRVCVLFLDLDDFKGINDIRGHAAGDQVLVAVAERLRAIIRPQDTAARFGGDEFVVLLEDLANRSGAEVAAARILDALRTPFDVPGFEVTVGASIGLAMATRRSSAEDLVLSADAALYVAKSQGKGRAVLFTEAMKAAVIQRYTLVRDLQEALKRDEFVLRFQPIVRLTDVGGTIAVETLVRWKHRSLGLLAPDTFIPLAEETGLIGDLDLWILEHACRRLASWTRAGWSAHLSITVNISGHQLQKPEFATRAREILKRTKVDPQRLILEITEGVVVADTSSAASLLEPLRARGVRIAVDDFGTGYSSLASLQHFPVDIIKIAKPFIDDLRSGIRGETFLKAILSLAGSLDLTVVAEGIELQAQAEHLRRLGCQLGQGYLLSRPLDEAALEEYVTSSNRITAAAEDLTA
ncbi:MAG: EAL domain-containing protein, partial [Candidatus Dormibacteraeota bacterium]|nr:EAL domain-containing protein [Candidatus Dormibacteraeota bacterium]